MKIEDLMSYFLLSTMHVYFMHFNYIHFCTYYRGSSWSCHDHIVVGFTTTCAISAYHH